MDETSPIVYGVADNLAVYSDNGESFSVAQRRRRAAGGGGGAQAARRRARDGPRHAGRSATWCRDVRRSSDDSRRPTRPTVQPWQYAMPTDEQLRNPLEHHSAGSAAARRRCASRDQHELLVSGLLDGGGDIAQRPVVVDVPMEKGHVVLFANNPVWRGETIGSYPLVFNTILNFDNLNAGRKLDAK